MGHNNNGQLTDSFIGKELIEEKRADGITRRKAIKTSAFALGACYLAPATLDLLLADRATAQSDPPPPPPVGGLGASRVCVCNFSKVGVAVTFLEVDNIICDENLETTDPGAETSWIIEPNSLPNDPQCVLHTSEIFIETVDQTVVTFKVTTVITNAQIASIVAGKMAVSDFANEIIHEEQGKEFAFTITQDLKVLVEDVGH